MSKQITIGRHTIGLDHPTYFVADIAANHDGDLSRAQMLVHLAAEAGANAAKFQNFRAETIVSSRGFHELGSKQTHQASWKKDVVEVYADASLPLEWTEALQRTCAEAGIDYFTAPYDLELIDFLAPYVCAWKVGSGDITWHEAIIRMAKDGKPVLIATGASSIEDVRAAMATVAPYTEDIVLMQCNTNYTSSVDNFQYINLNVLKTYAREFPGVVLGLSDHTEGHATVLGAIALGARVIEKHLTDDCTREGPDHAFSMDGESWRDMVERSRELEAALGEEHKAVMDNERETVVVQRRAIRAARAIAAGTSIGHGDLTVLRPCPPGALPPYQIEEIVGRRARRDLSEGECIGRDDVS
jgi:sialic acid synthase SpsE